MNEYRNCNLTEFFFCYWRHFHNTYALWLLLTSSLRVNYSVFFSKLLHIKIKQFHSVQFEYKFKNDTSCSPHILCKKENRTYCTNIYDNSTIIDMNKGPNIWVPSVRYKKSHFDLKFSHLNYKIRKKLSHSHDQIRKKKSKE